MLTKFLATLPFGSFVLADFSSMANDFSTVAQDIGVVNSNCDPNDGQCQRSFGSVWAQEIITNINGYGCWCYFQDAHGHGRGAPVNEVDAQCKILHDGYSCILMDHEEAGKDCTPWDVKYNSASGLGLLAADNDNDSLEYAIRQSCKRANKKSTCAAQACMVENYFVVSTMRIFLSGIKFDMSVRHDLGNFHPRDDCPIATGIKSEKACCGEQPLRFPYKHLNGDRGCCGEKTYNTQMMMCCNDGSIKVVC